MIATSPRALWILSGFKMVMSEILMSFPEQHASGIIIPSTVRTN
jgi:hypothetical protein